MNHWFLKQWVLRSIRPTKTSCTWQDTLYSPSLKTGLMTRVQEHIAAATVANIDRNMLLNYGQNSINVRINSGWLREYTLNICSMWQKLGQCMYLFMHHPSLYIVFLKIVFWNLIDHLGCPCILPVHSDSVSTCFNADGSVKTIKSKAVYKRILS